MELAIITARQVFILFLLICAGFVGVKTGALKKEYRRGFSDLLVYLVVPAMIINSYLTTFDTEILVNIVRTFALSVLALGLALIIAFILTRKDKSADRPIRWFALSFSNAGYMGFPLILALFGSEGLLYASVFVTVFNLLIWTIGFVVLSGDHDLRTMARSIAKTPALYAVAIGLVIFLAQIPVPELIAKPLGYLGDINTPLAMIITGIMIASSDLKSMVTSKKIWFIFLFRMLLIPAISAVLFFLIGSTGMVPKVVLILAACPTAAITSVFAVQYNYDEQLAAGAVVITTLCSIVTLPLFALLLETVL